MKSNQFLLTFKMFAVVGATVALGFQPSDSSASQEDPCALCEHQFYICGEWQDYNCVNQYLHCLRRYSCPPIESARGRLMLGTEKFVPVAGY